MKDKNFLLVNPTNLLYLESLSDDSNIDSFLSSGNIKNDKKIDNNQSSSNYDLKQLRVLQFITAHREKGHLIAETDPLHQGILPELSELNIEHYGLTDEDLNLTFATDTFFKKSNLKLKEIVSLLRETYCGTIGIEYMHIMSTDEKLWLQEKIEGSISTRKPSKSKKCWLLERLTSAETFEKFLHTKYAGQKRFSLEGGESLIPLLNVMIEEASAFAVKRVVLGMAHRGRLNVLINVLGKKAQKLFEEFSGDFELSKDQTGDVKYHMGFSANVKTANNNIHLSLAFNPSHLELVNPVVEGYARYHQDKDPEENDSVIMPVLIHGDAAFSGQGIIMETLNMSQSRGYNTHGTLHVVINNQIGFTTSKQEDARSTYYCTDVSKMVGAPIFHVNAEDIEAVEFVTKLAVEYRIKFKKDVVIDLVCYRRHGHNEADEPSVTQPIMYDTIRSMPTTREQYANKLIEEKIISKEESEEMIENYRVRLKNGERVAYNLETNINESVTKEVWKSFQNQKWTNTYDSSLSHSEILRLNSAMQKLPDDFESHIRVNKIMIERDKMATGKIDFDWGAAETLAYASLLDSGYPVRLSGQDCGRGTFFHRHAVIHNQKYRGSYIPLQHLSADQAKFQVIDSVLSEEAVLGFEYGYATANPESLVIWEAQFGDFANGAQAIIDQFIISGETKWGRLSGLVMMLPHGLEGQGPEHSSARLERYLQSCARYNIQVCIPSTASQIFHLLRRQMLRKYRKPLIILTPKSLLRNKLAASPLQKFTSGEFKIVIGEQYSNIDYDKVTRVIICSGKVFYDLLKVRQEQQLNHIAILRLEQLYPIDLDLLRKEFAKFKQANTYIWAQEEPINQGAWYSTQHKFIKVLGKSDRLHVVARSLSASPAEGNMKLHQKNQKFLVEQALGLQELTKF